MDWMTRITQLDRRWIFLLVAIAVILPQIFIIKMPMEPTKPVKQVFDFIEQIPEGGRVFIALDYDPSSQAELYPMTLSIMQHCFERHLRVIATTFWVTGKGLVSSAFTQMEKEYNISHGVDYANYGFQVGYAYVVMQAGLNFPAALPIAKGQRTDEMEITRGVQKLADMDYIIDLAAGASIDMWVAYGVERYKFKLGGGVTAVSATQYYPYLDTGQLNGLIGGLKGAAEYEILVNDEYSKKANPLRKIDVDQKVFLGNGTKGMGSQSIVHALIIFLVVITNIFFFITKRKV